MALPSRFGPWLLATAIAAAVALVPSGQSTARERDIQGAWTGRYVCGQGATGANLTLSVSKLDNTWLGLEVYLHRMVFGLIGGSYRPPQGAAERDDAIRAVTGRFSFHGLPENPGVPDGTFELEGRFDPASGVLYLVPVAWIEQPEGYRMLGITALLDKDGQTLKGAFDAPECGALLLAQAGAEQSPATSQQSIPVKSIETTPELDALNAQYLELYNAGNYAGAVAKAEEARALAERVYGQDHPTVALVLRSLALALTGTGRSSKVEPLLRRALAIDEQSLGLDHPAVALDIRMLAGALLQRRQAADAESTDVTTLALTGQLPSVLYKAVPLALIISIVLLAVYRRAVLRSMRRPGQSPDAHAAQSEPPTQTAPAGPAEALQIVTVSDSPGPAERARLWRGPWRSAAIYAGAVLAYAVTLIIVYTTASDLEWLPLRTLFLTLIYAWPAVLVTGFVAATSWRTWLAAIAIYAVLLAALALSELAVSEKLTWDQPVRLWLLANLPGTFLTLAFFPRPLRAVGPMVLVLAIAVIAGSVLWLYLFEPTDLMPLVNAFSGLGMDSAQAVSAATYAVQAAGVLLLGAGGWLLMRGIGALYQRHMISDQAMIADTLVLMFALTQAIDFVFFGIWYFFAPLGAFAVYKLVALIGFRLARRHEPEEERSPRLLLLRVFSLGRRSARLFDTFGKLWRHEGSISLIAGPDLATSTVEPYEFLDFLSGRLARRFIAGPETLRLRLAEAEQSRDVDGRYRVSDFFCHDDTWQTVLRQLARGSDAVLMDLRGFSPDNRGCMFEINELLGTVPLDRVMFVVDDTTDQRLLHDALAQGWQDLPADSPNRSVAEPRAMLFRFSGAGAGSVASLAAATLQAARTRKSAVDEATGAVGPAAAQPA